MWVKGILLAGLSAYLAYQLNDKEITYTWDFWLLNASIVAGLASALFCFGAIIRDISGVCEEGKDE